MFIAASGSSFTLKKAYVVGKLKELRAIIPKESRAFLSLHVRPKVKETTDVLFCDYLRVVLDLCEEPFCSVQLFRHLICGVHVPNLLAQFANLPLLDKTLLSTDAWMMQCSGVFVFVLVQVLDKLGELGKLLHHWRIIIVSPGRTGQETFFAKIDQ